jgi:hypothetical protein
MYLRRERNAGDRGPPRPLGAASPLVQAEMRAALEAQQQPLFWFELRVVQASHAACRVVAGAIAGRRRENVLRQRNLLALHDADRELDYAAGAERALERADADAWTVISIRSDWSTVFPA